MVDRGSDIGGTAQQSSVQQMILTIQSQPAWIICAIGLQAAQRNICSGHCKYNTDFKFDDEAPPLPPHFQTILFLNKHEHKLKSFKKYKQNEQKKHEAAYLIKILDQPLPPPTHAFLSAVSDQPRPFVGEKFVLNPMGSNASPGNCLPSPPPPAQKVISGGGYTP